MKRSLILCIAMVLLTIPSVTKAESSVAYRQDSHQDKYRLEDQNREQQERDRQRQRVERDRQQRAGLERDRQQRERIERDRQQRGKMDRDRQQREGLERDRQQRERVERDRQQRGRMDRDRQQREGLERDRQQRERVERDRQQRGRMEHDRQRDHQRQNDRHREDFRRKGNHDWSHSAYSHDRWRSIARPSFRNIPFNWHERAGSHSSHHHFEQIHDRQWHDRFPGLRIFRWIDRSGSGFWYNDHHIVDAMMFYNESDELVSIGFYHNNMFIMLRDDGNGYENHDNFFSLWWLHQSRR